MVRRERPQRSTPRSCLQRLPSSFLSPWQFMQAWFSSFFQQAGPYTHLSCCRHAFFELEYVFEAKPTLPKGFIITAIIAQLCPTVCNPMDCSPPGSPVHGDSPGKYTGVACHALLQGIFPTQRSNSGLLHYRWILYYLSHQGSESISKSPTFKHSPV